MSTLPPMSSGRSRARRARGRRQRRRVAGGLLAVAIATTLVVSLGFGNSSVRSQGLRHRSAALSASSPGRPHTATAPSNLSPAGLPLARPGFGLKGVGSPGQDPVHVSFHAPPGAGLLFDLDTGRVLWQRNAAKRMEIASLTKMMTALLTVQSAPANARVLVTRQALRTDGSKVGVLPLGRLVPLESMLYGLMLPSGNDAAVALAQRVSGTVGSFVKRMNAEAARLGLGCTLYASPSGYVDAQNYSCAADLAVLAHVDLAQPRIARVARTFRAILPFPIRGGKLYLFNNNPLMFYGYPGLTGLKTGFTTAAGRCLVATAERHGVRLGVVLLNSPGPATQARHLLDEGFQRVYHQAPVAEPPIPAGA